MRWKWKVIAIGTGSFLGGPPGGIIGWAIGHWLDSKDEKRAQRLTPGNLTAEMVCCITSHMVADTIGLNAKSRKRIVSISKAAGEEKGPVTLDLEPIVDTLSVDERKLSTCVYCGQENGDFCELLIRSAYRVACAGKTPSDAELGWIAVISEAMGVSESQLQMLSLPFIRPGKSKQALIDAQGVLGVPPNAIPDDIKTKYRELSRKYHPDNHATVDDALRELASEKFAMISTAYATLMSHNRTEFWGVSDVHKRLFLAEAKQVVRCFFCAQKCRLPDPAHLSTARCPVCQSLLLFDRDTADAFLSLIEDAERRYEQQRRPRARAGGEERPESKRPRRASKKRSKEAAASKKKAAGKKKPSKKTTASKKKATGKKKAVSKKKAAPKAKKVRARKVSKYVAK